MTRHGAILLALAALLALPAAAAGQGKLRLRTVASGLAYPVAAAAPPANRHDLYVGDLAGRVFLIRDGRRRQVPFLDIRSAIGRPRPMSEEGFFSLVFAPDFRRSRRFYVSYSSTARTQRVDEWRANRAGTAVVPGSRRNLLDLPHPEPHHFGGDMHFGRDRKLYISVGDGAADHGTPQQGVLAQDLSSLHGKILRIDPRPTRTAPYRVPRGNPFARTRGARPEIWAYGLRNPWRFTIDTRRGDLIIGDVGDEQREEVDWLRGRRAGRGANFGWPCREGAIPFHHAPPGCRAPNAVAPVFDYGHFDDDRRPTVRPGQRVHPAGRGGVHAAHMTHGCTGSIAGGHVVRDPQLGRLRGRYVFGDHCAGWLLEARRRGRRAIVHGLRQIAPGDLVSFAQDGCGRLYVVQLVSGKVKRLQRARSRCVRALR